jgi:hypothetical protein
LFLIVWFIPSDLLTVPIGPNLATTLGYDPSYDWHHYSMVQAWMGKAKSTVGTVIGQDLYNQIYKMLDDSCPATGGEGHCAVTKPNGRTDIVTKCIRNWPADIVDCKLSKAHVKSTCANVLCRRHHRLSRRAVAERQHPLGTHLRRRGLPRRLDNPGHHWWNQLLRHGWKEGLQRWRRRPCKSLPPIIRNIKLTFRQVNFPDAGFGDTKHHNYWHITLANPWARYGSYDCCKGDGLSQMDRVLEGLERRIRDGYPEVWGGSWFRDSRCIINGWATCPLS